MSNINMSLKYMSRNICLYIVSIDNDISFSFNIQLIFNKKNICISWGGRSSPYFMSPFSWSMWTGCPIARNVPESISTVHVLRHVEGGGREPTWVSEWKKRTVSRLLIHSRHFSEDALARRRSVLWREGRDDPFHCTTLAPSCI